MDKKKVFLWSLYDFANSIPNIVFYLYFSQWLVVEHGVSDLWYNMIFFGSSLLLVFSTPIAGAIADHINVRKPFLVWATLLQIVAFVGSGAAAMLATSSTDVLVSAFLYMIGIYFYQFSLTFYNALLTDIAEPARRGFVSGVGQFANWFGQIVALFAIGGFASGAWVLFGEPGRVQTFLPATLLMILGALPLLLWYRERSQPRLRPISIRGEYRGMFVKFKELLKIPGVGRYLLAFFLFNDALLTAASNFPIYLEQVFGVSDTVKSFVLAGVLLTSALGGLAGGWIADKYGLKRTLLITLALWISVFPMLASLTNFSWFIVAVVAMGLLYGATWAVTRAVMAALVPHEKLNHAFSYYTLAERFSTFTAPLTWGVIVTVFVYIGPLRYQLAMVAMTLFLVLGFLVVRKVPLER